MKLHIYDHCPFCVHARMISDLRSVEVENIVPASDGEDTPIGMTGTRQVPILGKDDDTFMGESLDIVYYTDETANKGRLKTEVRPKLQTWFDEVGEYNNHLAQPRLVKIGLPEFATESAVQYFIDKEEKDTGSFETNLNGTAQYLERLSQGPAQLEVLTTSGPDGIGGETGMEGILIFPTLRNLIVVRGVQWSAEIADYLAWMSAQSGVPLCFDCAL